MRRRLYLLALPLVGAVAIGAALTAHARPRSQAIRNVTQADQAALPANPADGPVRAAVEQALRLHQGLTVPPVVTPGANATEADLARQDDLNTTAIHDKFAAVPAEREIAALNKSISLQRTGHFRVLGAGIKNLTLVSISYDTTGAVSTVTGTVEIWSKMSFVNPDGLWHPAEPHNVFAFNMTLTQTRPNRWVVQTFDWEFTPETSP